MKNWIILLVALPFVWLSSCAEDETDPKIWVKKLNESAEIRKDALEKLEFIYEVDTTLQETCHKLTDEEWQKTHREEKKALEDAGKWNQYTSFCGKYKAKLDKKIPRFREIVIPALIDAYKQHNDWNQDEILKLLIRFQDPQKPIELEARQGIFLEILDSFGGPGYLLEAEKIDARVVVAIKGLTELNKVKPHPQTFEKIKGLLKKIYQRPVENDSISQVRMALVASMLDLRGTGASVNKAFDADAAELLVEMIRRGKHDTADEALFCQGTHCKQNFLVNKNAAIQLGQLGVANKRVNNTLVGCLYSVEIGLGRLGKSFRECKVALSKLYKPEMRGTEIDPVGILGLLAQGDPARYPLAYDEKKDRWFASKDGETYVMYGADPNQSTSRSKMKECMGNYEKFRNSDYFTFVTRRQWEAEMKFKKEKADPAQFEAYLTQKRADHKKRTSQWGEGACEIFDLNERGKWDTKDSAVVERTALEALRGMGAAVETQNVLLDTYSSVAMTAFWDFTAEQSYRAAMVRCKKEGMQDAFLKTECVPEYTADISGTKSQWNKLRDYNWLVDSSKEAMYGAGWLMSAAKNELNARTRAEMEHRLRWLRDPRSTTYAAKSLAMMPYDKGSFEALMDVASFREGGDKKNTSEPWFIATELLWEQFRQQTIQMVQGGKNRALCEKIENAAEKKECETLMEGQFDEIMKIFQQWSTNKDRWLRTRYLWVTTMQQYFGYWPVDAASKKAKALEPKEFFTLYKAEVEKCKARIKEFEGSKDKGDPKKEPVCDGFDIAREYKWVIQESQAARDMKKAGLNPKEAEKRLVLSGYERIRLDLLESAFDYASVADFERLLDIKPEDIMSDPGVHPLENINLDKATALEKQNLELTVQRPWNDKMEQDRRARAKELIQEELDTLKKPILDLRNFLCIYKDNEPKKYIPELTKECEGKVDDLQNISNLRTIVSRIIIRKDCPETVDGKVPPCAVFEENFNEKTGKVERKRLPSSMEVITPWKVRRKALYLINAWDKEVNPADRKEMVKVLAEAYDKAELTVREAIMLTLDRWGTAEDYPVVAPIIQKVIDTETANMKRGGWFWMNQDAQCFLGRLQGKK